MTCTMVDVSILVTTEVESSEAALTILAIVSWRSSIIVSIVLRVVTHDVNKMAIIANNRCFITFVFITDNGCY